MDVAITQIQFALDYPVQMDLTFATDSTATIVDIRDAHVIIQRTPTEIITLFGRRIYDNFNRITPALIATDPLANSLLMSHRRFKILEVTLHRKIRYDFLRTFFEPYSTLHSQVVRLKK